MIKNYVVSKGFGGAVVSLEIEFSDHEPLVLQFIEEKDGAMIHTGLQVNGQAELYLSNEEDKNYNYSLLDNVEGLENALPVTFHVQEGIIEKILSAKDEQTIARSIHEMFSLSTWDENVVQQKKDEDAPTAGIGGDWAGTLTLIENAKEKFMQIQDILQTILDDNAVYLKQIKLKIIGSNPFAYGFKLAFNDAAETIQNVLSGSASSEVCVEQLRSLPAFSGYDLVVEEKVLEIARKRRAIMTFMRSPNVSETIDKLREIPGYEHVEAKDIDMILADPARDMERGVVFTVEGMQTFAISME